MDKETGNLRRAKDSGRSSIVVPSRAEWTPTHFADQPVKGQYYSIQSHTCFLLGEINIKHSALAIRIINDSTLN